MVYSLKPPVFWGVVATLCIVLFAASLGIGDACYEDGECENRFRLFLSSPPNEIGDTLAGFAGALAFVWIIVTVMLQSNELSAQREELELTREEMAEQRKATQDMANALHTQAKIFEDEMKYRSESRAKAILEQLLLSLEEHLKRNSTNYWRYSGKKKVRSKKFMKLDGRGRYARPMEETDAELRIALVTFSAEKSLEENIIKQEEISANNLKKILSISNDEVRSRPNRQTCEDLAGVLNDIELTLDQLAEDQEIRVRNLGILRFSKTIFSALEADIWQESLQIEDGGTQ